MPAPATLPPDLQALARRNALELSDTRWRTDMQRLVEALNELLRGTSAILPQPPAPPPARNPIHVALVAGAAGLVGRGLAELLRPDSVSGKQAKITDVVVWRGVAWLFVGAAVAVFLTARPSRAVTGALVGALAGAGGAAIYALPRYLAATRPSDGVLDLLSIAEFAFTGALIGALVGALWNRRAGAGMVFGLVAGAIIELLVIASGWSVDSPAERVLKVGLDAFVIVGLVAAALPLRERQASTTAASASPRVA
jgi:hypothetical protein